jgi:carbamoyltransferase
MGAIVGISCLTHDAAIAVIRDDRIVFASHSERYSRKKNDRYLNQEVVDDAVREAGSIQEIAFYERPLVKRARQLCAGQLRSAFVTPLPGGYLRTFFPQHRRPVRYFNHHLSHACAGYFTSPFRHAAIVVADAIGEWETLTVWEARDRTLRRIASVRYPNSIGLLYSAFTQRVGYKPNEEEYIVMGLAALGQPLYADLIRRDFIEEAPSPLFRLKRNVHRGIRSWRPALRDIENIAASCQAVVEDALLAIFRWVAKQITSRNLVFCGGVALNCVLNARVAKAGLFDDIWIPPEPGDAGSSLGAALAVRREWIEWTGPYLGHEITRTLDVEGALAALTSGHIVGVAHGRAEFGPRALGNRSLLADPRPLTTKDRVNAIKKREPFRPFAPVVLEEHARFFFDLPLSSSPYMQWVAPCKCPLDIPAVCHVDDTSRVQTLTRRQNPAMYELLERFFSLTGCPVLLNTSLNVKGEPLVNSWTDAQRFSSIHAVPVF